MTLQNSDEAGKTIVLNVAWVAFEEAGPGMPAEAEEYIRQLLPQGTFFITAENPDIILFMTGGSERKAISLIGAGNLVLLLSYHGVNAYAAATEVMAWAVNNNLYAVLSDAGKACETGLIDRWRTVAGIWRNMMNKNAGLIGNVADWLVASDVTAEKLRDVFGVALRQIPWDEMQDYSTFEPDPALLERFGSNNTNGIDDPAKLLSLLRKTIKEYDLSAIAVECFPIVRIQKVSACLALAQLNAEGIVSACEGDLASMAGMMMLEAVASQVPWMANTTAINGNTLLLSHCTISFNLVSDVRLVTHFETDCSLAIKGVIPQSDVTVFRLSGSLDKAFIAEGRIIGTPSLENACRTQVEIELPSRSVDMLRERPLGNHLLMMPGKHAELLRLACLWKKIKVLTD